MDIDYNAVFGLDTPAEEAKESTDVAGGTDAGELAGGGAGEEAQELAEPDEVGEADGDDNSGDDGAGEGESAGKKPSKKAQSDEDNASFAAARRRAEAERDRMLEAQAAQHAAEMDSFVASMKLKNPATGKDITTKAEYDEYQRSQRRAEAEKKLARAGLSVDMISDVVKDIPEVRQAKEAAEQMTAARLSAEREKQKSVFEAEMKQISGDDPTVKSVEDLKEKPYFDELYEKVKAGYSLYDAYRLVTYEDHDKRTAEKARRQAMSSAAGKSHLRPAQSRGGELSSPPSDVLAEYRIFFPGASDAEIARLWAKDKKNRNDL